MRNGRRFWILAALVAPALAACAAGKPAERPEEATPSVLLLSLDSLRADHAGCYGYGRPTTPNLDRLAAEGVRFETAIAASAWTSPSLVSLVTGQSPARHGVHNRADAPRADAPALPKLLAAQGYAVPNLFYPNRIPNYENLGYGAPDPLLKAADPRSPTADEQRAALLQWLKENGDRRFFVWFHDAKLHLPYDPPAVHLEKFSKYTRDQLDRTSPGVHAVLNQVIIPAGSVAWRPTDRERIVDLYDAEVAEADAFLGEVLDVLRARGALDRTIVIVTADHGEELLDHGEVGHASTTGQATLYDELLRVPLVVRYPPAVMARRVEYAQVRTIDVAPTVLALLGRPAPAEMQGFPLKAALEGKLFSTRPAYSETNLGGYPSTPDQQAARLRSIRDGDWKMVCRFDEQESCRLFNLRDDPGETRNVVTLARSKARELRGELDRWTPPR